MEQKKLNSFDTPVKQGSVVNLVMNRIKEALINQELKPGDYLPTENELMEKLGVSKTSIREAIKMLQALGVLEMKRGQGTRIRNNSSGDMIDPLIFQLILQSGRSPDVVELRMMYEPAYTLLAMQNAREEDIDAIRESSDHFRMAVQNGEQTVEDDLNFHLSILNATHNPFVIRIGETIYHLFKAAMEISLQSNPTIALRDHTRIFEAFCEKDVSKVQSAILQSFENWKTGM